MAGLGSGLGHNRLDLDNVLARLAGVGVFAGQGLRVRGNGKKRRSAERMGQKSAMPDEQATQDVLKARSKQVQSAVDADIEPSSAVRCLPVFVSGGTGCSARPPPAQCRGTPGRVATSELRPSPLLRLGLIALTNRGGPAFRACCNAAPARADAAVCRLQPQPKSSPDVPIPQTGARAGQRCGCCPTVEASGCCHLFLSCHRALDAHLPHPTDLFAPRRD